MDHAEFLSTVPPWDGLAPDELARLAADFRPRSLAAGERVLAPDEPIEGLHVIRRGRVRVSDEAGAPLSTLGPRDAFGERGLMRDGIAPTEATAAEETEVLTLPAERFRALVEADPAVAAFFARARPAARASSEPGRDPRRGADVARARHLPPRDHGRRGRADHARPPHLLAAGGG